NLACDSTSDRTICAAKAGGHCCNAARYPGIVFEISAARFPARVCGSPYPYGYVVFPYVNCPADGIRYCEIHVSIEYRDSSPPARPGNAASSPLPRPSRPTTPPRLRRVHITPPRTDRQHAPHRHQPQIPGYLADAEQQERDEAEDRLTG